jgi:methionyl aminopeptidase
MAKAGELAARCLDMLTGEVKAGVSTDALDRLAYAFIRDHGATPATVYYKGYSRFLCTSVNHVVCHGIPSTKPLRDGDILNIDVTVIVDGWHGDTSRMFWAGEPRVKAKRLCDVTYEAMMRGIQAARPGKTTGDIGYAIQVYAEGDGFGVVRDFCGHGVHRVFHDAPSVVHYGEPGGGQRLVPGMIFTIEPMINLGTWQTKLKSDGWTAVTRDRSLSAQFEHTIAVTEGEPRIFTRSPSGLHKPPYSS